jgi:hypothetical protein
VSPDAVLIRELDLAQMFAWREIALDDAALEVAFERLGGRDDAE